MIRIVTILLSLIFATSLSAQNVGDLLNAERSAAGLPPLIESAQLNLAAKAHALDMSGNGNLSHTGSDGSSVSQRIERAGYQWCSVAENIAQGQGSPEAAMASWMSSRGHRENNLSPDSREFGAAWAEGNYWVLVFASPC